MITVCGKEIRVTGKFVRTARLEAEGYFFLDGGVPAFLEEVRKSKSRIDLFTFTQQVPEKDPKYGYQLEWDNCAAIPVSTFDEWWKQLRPEARNRARQAEKKGVVIREVPFDQALAEGICGIYNESAVRQDRKFRHFGKDVATVYKEHATFLEHSFFIGAFLEDTLIGFVKLTTDETGTQANLMNILSMVKHRDKAPTNALVANAVKACAERGISYLAYQKYTYGKKQPDGIMKFKEVNGFQQFDLPRYFVPFTLLGRLALSLGLQNRFVDRLPQGFVTRLRELRVSWYDLMKRQTAKEAGR